jgi:hypothetical protein
MKFQLRQILAACCIAMLALTSCKKQVVVKVDLGPRVESAVDGPVKATVTLTPGVITLDRHLILSLRVVYPSNIEFTPPNLEDRTEGFVVGHSFEKKGTDASGNQFFEKVARLTPTVGGKYRIAPIPVVYYSSAAAGREKHWFPTPALWLEAPVSESAAFEEYMEPLWIRPSALEVSIYIVLTIILLLAIVLIFILIKKALSYVRLLRMSPRERALEELRMLMGKDLVAKDKVKDFYLELTMIVRLFIERGYKIRAPEQTTEEFLTSAGKDKRFPARILNKLTSFLQSADLVKFAGFKPDRETTDQALSNAKDFIKVESAANLDAGRKREVDDA